MLGPDKSSFPPVTESAPSGASQPLPSGAANQFAALAPDDETALLARVVFPAGWSRLSSKAQAELAPLIARLLGSEETRIIINGFARDATNTPSAARRLSLARAMAVRSLMVEQGIRSTRIELHALGADAANGPADRVDILLPRG
jgi:outer membrane protein OmpA-like peptidoglycan-associated protein